MKYSEIELRSACRAEKRFSRVCLFAPILFEPRSVRLVGNGRVHFDVRVQARPGDELLAAVVALVRPLPRVVAFVNDHARVLRERFPASVAGVRFLAGVSPLVNHQRAPLDERLPADIADQQLLAAVQSQMILQR